MISKMFNNANILEKGLDASWLKMEVASQNIANADTPGYDAKHVEFDTQFAAALNNSSQGNLLKQTSNAMGTVEATKTHFNIGPQNPMNVTPTVVSDTHYVARMDDNNVNIDREMVDLAKNTIQYNAMAQKINKEFAKLKLAIRGGT